MENEFGMKELYDLTLKATYPIEMEGRIFEVGEVIARFDKIQLANFQEIVSRITAKGGYDNRARIFWEDPQQINLSFTQGIFSKRQLALLSNAKLVKKTQGETILVPSTFTGESDSSGKISLDKKNVSNVFVYNAETFDKLPILKEDLSKGEIFIEPKYQNVLVDYNFNYSGIDSTIQVGEKLIKGYLLLEGKTRVKDDITGKTHTAILRIPRLKLVSDLSMRLGREAGPMVASFNAMGLPIGTKGSKKIMELIFLNDDLDADM